MLDLAETRARFFPRDIRAFCYTLGGLLLAFSLLVRFLWYHVVTTDYLYFVRAWFETLAAHPWLTAFRQPFADYAPLYLYLIKLLTLIPVGSLYSAKTLSLLCDAIIAYCGYRTVRAFAPGKDRPGFAFLAGAVLFALPTVMINSSLWGQSDALYAAGVMAALYFMLEGAPRSFALAYSIALSLKVQAIFFAPVFIGYLLRRRETRPYILLPLAVFTLSIIPAWLSGGSFAYWFFIYMKEAGEYPYLSVSGQSLFALVQPFGLSAGITALLFWLGILLALLVTVRLARAVATRPALTPQFLVLVSFMAVLLLPYVLPRMHERYFYLADLFSVLYAFFYPRRYLLPVLVVFASLVSYMPFLSSQVGFLSTFREDLRVPALLLLIPLVTLLYDFWCAEPRAASP